MKIKQTTFYALRVIRRVHLEGKGIITSNLIAEKENLSQGVVLRLLREMAHAGILFIHQGRGIISGGFSMRKTIDEITLLEIVETLEKVDICQNLDKKNGEIEDLLFLKFNLINEHLKEEFSKYSVKDLFNL